MSESDQLVAFDARDGAEAHRRDVAAHHLHADRAAIDEVRGCVGIDCAARAAALHRIETERLEKLACDLGGVIAHAAEQQRGCDGHELGTVGAGVGRVARDELMRVIAQVVGAARRRVTSAFAGIERSVLAIAATVRADRHRHGEGFADGERACELVEHRLDGRDARDGLRSECPSVGVGSDHPAVDVDGASAHARDHFGDLEPGVRGLDEDQVLMRAKVLDGAEHFDIEALGLGAAEDGEAVAFHAGFDLGDRHDSFTRPEPLGRASASGG